MAFLNAIMLLGLAAVAIPIVIHILNRRQARIVDWGAMRFLLLAAASQTRNIRIQEMLLLLFRCGWLAMLAMALALPVVPSRSGVSWWLVLPLVLAGAAGAGLAGGWNGGGRARNILAWVSAGLILSGAGLGAYERWRQGQIWDVRTGAKDVAILIDESSSMSAKLAEPSPGGGAATNFQRAVEEARLLIGGCNKSDTVGIILGGPVGRRATPGCISDRKELDAVLNAVEPAGGTMDAAESLLESADCLADGPNLVKQIIILTDGQRIGWQSPVSGSGAKSDESAGRADPSAAGADEKKRRWQNLTGKIQERLAGRAGADSAMPKMVLRLLPLPGSRGGEGRAFTNLAIDDLSIPGRPPGLDRPAEIAVSVANTGQTPIEKRDIIIYEAGREIGRQSVGPILPGASQTVSFEHSFARPGRVILRAVLDGEDDLADDDSAWRVFDIASTLGVLIIDGRGVAGHPGQAAENLAVALAPGSGMDYLPGGRNQPASRPGDEKFLFRPEIVPVDQFGKIADLTRYNLVVLADVPLLRTEQAAKLESFVRRGGGLWIAPGQAADPDFYNRWVGSAGLPVPPAELQIRQNIVGAGDDGRPAIESLAGSAFISAAKFSGGDFQDVSAVTIWRLKANPADRSVAIPAAMRSGLPFFAERRIGKGIVLMSAVATDNSDSNLPRLKCFEPLVHELSMELSLPSRPQWNIKPGRTVGVELPADLPGLGDEKNISVCKLSAPPAQPGKAANEALQIIAQWQAPLERSEKFVRAEFARTSQPGLYGFIVPRAGVAGEIAGNVAGRRIKPDEKDSFLPFVVLGEPGESRMAGLASEDFEAMRSGGLDLTIVNSAAEAIAATGGGVPGRTLWRQLLLGAVACMFCELAMARFISARRRLNRVGPVQLSGSPIGMVAVKSRIRQMMPTNKTGPEYK